MYEQWLSQKFYLAGVSSLGYCLKSSGDPGASLKHYNEP